MAVFNFFKTKNIITFSDISGASAEYQPQPATKYVPEWYKKTENRFPENIKHPKNSETIKKCVPVFDAITAGYIIVSRCDVYVTIEDGEPKYTSAFDAFNRPFKSIEYHSMKQAHLHPEKNGFKYPKWISPWKIQTPKGYSVLFKPPAHNPNPWFTALEGIVDTDVYTSPVNFPFVLKDPTKECFIPAGTPIVQVIPFKRENWTMQVVEDDTKLDKVDAFINSQFWDRYKRLMWTRKEYK